MTHPRGKQVLLYPRATIREKHLQVGIIQPVIQIVAYLFPGLVDPHPLP